MEFGAVLLAVRDVEVSKQFYGALFDQKVVCDFGKNVTFSGGFAIQEDFAWLTDLPKESIMERAHNMELYFETEDLDGFVERLKSFPAVEYVHPVKMYDWKQRVIRIYDPDGHIIEVGESMMVVAKRFLTEGYAESEVAETLQLPAEVVAQCHREMQKTKE